MNILRFRDLMVPEHRAHVAVTRIKPGEAAAPHRHDFFEAFLVLDGRGNHHVNGACVTLDAGHLVMIRPEDTHWYSSMKDEPLTFLNVAISSTWWKTFHRLMALPEGWERKGGPEGHRLLSPRQRMRIGSALRALDMAVEGRSLDLAEAWLQIVEAFQAPESSVINPPAWLEEWREELFAAVETLDESMSWWQKRSRRSPEHLARSCRTHYGLTPSDLINQARIERAKLLLRTTDEKVIFVALDCGFKNMANFHRLFLRGTGMTPGRWRRNAAATVPIR